MMDTYSDKGWNISNHQLPIHFIAGSYDPCITSLKDFQAAADHMKKVGYACMTTKAYDGLRHEILNETGKEEVWSDILNYINGLLTSDNRAR
jgi:alpha-beta hydrolase superfamily lysophospholipase